MSDNPQTKISIDYTPQHVGTYWARSLSSEWYDLIVEVTGEMPFLKINQILNLAYTRFDSAFIKWGPEITRPDVN